MFDKIIGGPRRPGRRTGAKVPGKLLVTPPIDVRLTVAQKKKLARMAAWEKKSAASKYIFRSGL